MSIIRTNWELDFAVSCIHHNSGQTRRKTDVCRVTTRTRNSHQSNRTVSTFVRHTSRNFFRNFVDSFVPVVDNQVVAFLIRQKTLIVLFLNQSCSGVTFSDDFWDFFAFVNCVVFFTDRKTRFRHVSERQTFDFVGDFHGHFCAINRKHIGQNFVNLLLGLWIVVVRVIFWQQFVKVNATKSCVSNFTFDINSNWSLKRNHASFVSHFCFVNTCESFALFFHFALFVVS